MQLFVRSDKTHCLEVSPETSVAQLLATFEASTGASTLAPVADRPAPSGRMSATPRTAQHFHPLGNPSRVGMVPLARRITVG